MTDCNELLAGPQQPPSWQDTPIDNWPRRSSSMEADLTTNTTTTSYPKPKPPRVSFSEISLLFRYEGHELCMKQLAYDKEDRKVFKTEAKLEARRIRNLIENAPPASADESMEFLTHHGIMSKDELVGIEPLILGASSRILKTRKLHSQIVLRKQYEQRNHNHQLKDDPVMSLGRIAQRSSLKSAKLARVRAAY